MNLVRRHSTFGLHLPSKSVVGLVRTSAICALGRSRPAADASREVVDRWLLDALM
jgi:hypothetical protein